eukprot:TRINITY_DN5239_c0_g1_i2.p1 TRINITY_DN5239_c0_g1~~TRINITY_DN5239_c0_g1_i2.p1  ORF type:complete len:102 (+),score=24.36 TRINITY_DN5239_c0_g1_i2:274-579(+)
MTVDEIFNRYEKKREALDEKAQGDVEALKHVLTTLEVVKEKYVKLEVVYCLLKSILKTRKYFELRKGGRHERKYVRRRAIIKNINRRIVCQQNEIEGKDDS